MLQIIRASMDDARRALYTQLVQHLQTEERVLWLVSGGSNIPIAVAVMAGIPSELSKGLTVMLTDERYGSVGHNDSNAQQLLEAGFDMKQGMFLHILSGASYEDTATTYMQTVREQFSAHAIKIGQLGMGADGHIAGILPRSVAAYEQAELAVSYIGADFARITLTCPALQHITTAFACVYGANKQTALTQLRDQQLSVADQPAQILKAIPQAYVYNDQIE